MGHDTSNNSTYFKDKYENITPNPSKGDLHRFLRELMIYYFKAETSIALETNDIDLIKATIQDLHLFLESIDRAISDGMKSHPHEFEGVNGIFRQYLQIPSLMKNDIALLSNRIEILEQSRTISDYVKSFSGFTIENVWKTIIQMATLAISVILGSFVANIIQ